MTESRFAPIRRIGQHATATNPILEWRSRMTLVRLSLLGLEGCFMANSVPLYKRSDTKLYHCGVLSPAVAGGLTLSPSA